MLSGISAVLWGSSVLMALMLTSLPVFVAFMIINLIAVMYMLGAPAFSMLANSFYETTTSTSLVTIPLFILMGEVLFRSHAVDVLFRSIDTLIGRVKGRQYVLSIALATVFSALSGAAMGVAAMMGRSLLPGMVKRGYDPVLSAGNILAGASLAPLIPPSVLAIIVGTLAGVSIAELLIAGIIPGLVLAALFLIYTYIRVYLNPDLAPQDTADELAKAYTAQDKWLAVARTLPFGLVILSVMGTILSGMATPNEAGAVGVFGSVVAAAIYRRLSFRMLAESIASAAKISSMILIIMASAKLFSQMLAFSGGATAMTHWIVNLGYSKWLMLLILLLLPFVLCMFIDQVALMLIILPIYKLVLAQFGFDPLWFWLLFLINITVGGLTPPFGYTLFALKGAWAEGTLGQVYRAAIPFVGLFILGVVIMALFPGLVTFLPNLL